MVTFGTVLGLGALLLVAAPAFAFAQGAMQVLTIDPVAGRTDPALPAVNVWSEPSILVRVADPSKKVYLAVQTPDRETTTDDLSPGAIIINFKRGKSSQLMTVARNHSGIWTVTASGRTAIGIRAVVFDRRDIGHNQLYPIQIEWKPWFTEFSAGFSVLTDIAGRKYALKPAETGSDLVLADIGSTADMSYRASAFVHYVPLVADWFAFSFGVSTDIPVSNLSLMLGGSLRLRTLPIINDGFLTLGAAFTPTRRLRGSVGDVVPAGTDLDSLMETKYGIGFFAAVTFGFLGGEERFKGVYGSAQQGSVVAEPAPVAAPAAPSAAPTAPPLAPAPAPAPAPPPVQDPT